MPSRRHPKNLPTPDEEPVLAALESGTQKEYFAVDVRADQIVFARPIVLTSDCLACHGDPAPSPTHDGCDVLGYKMENWPCPKDWQRMRSSGWFDPCG